MTNHTEAMQKLAEGDIVHAIFTPLTDIMGPWIYVFIYAITAIMIYLKTQTVVMPVIITLVFAGAGMVALPPEYEIASYILLAIAIAGILYTTFKGD